jgi:hypothetical protein
VLVKKLRYPRKGIQTGCPLWFLAGYGKIVVGKSFKHALAIYSKRGRGRPADRNSFDRDLAIFFQIILWFQ